MFECLQVFLNVGLYESEPINIKFSRLVSQTSEEFPEFAEEYFQVGVQLDKKQLHHDFLKLNPDCVYKLTQKKFTEWLRKWAVFKNLSFSEGHSGNLRYGIFSIAQQPGTNEDHLDNSQMDS